MGFGFNLFFIFILIPLIGIRLIAWLLSKKLSMAKLVKLSGVICFGILGLLLVSKISRCLTSKTELTKEDYYGEYIINRKYFKGKETDWQYNHFRFEITKKDSIFFYVTNKDKILEIYSGTIKTTTPYNSARLIIKMAQPHHILTSNPTTHRSVWNYYLVFNSPKFSNMFFEKGKWRSIE